MPRNRKLEAERVEGKGALLMTEAVGWASSCILVLTIAKQVYKQWKEGSSEGVSRWLFVGQMAASLGFTVYSWLVGNWVFVATNAVMLLNGVAGLLIVLHHRRRERRA
jgi:MtN3 and saliva related transmembrane protein